MLTQFHNEPKTYQDALSSKDSKDWKIAIKKEYDMLVEMKTWELVPRPPGCKVIGSRWVFRVKPKEDGTIASFKARLVAQGFSQIEGIDYTNAFAPVSNLTSIRVILAIVAHFDLELDQMDVKSAYLNGKIDVVLYMKQPEGFIVKGKENYVCKLLRSLYGIKQAGNIWNHDLHNTLVTLGFTRLKSDACIYTKGSLSNGDFLLVALWVDDLLAAGQSRANLDAFKVDFSKCYEVKDLNAAHHYLGWIIERDRSKKILKVTQQQFIIDVLKTFGMYDCNGCTTPMVTDFNHIAIEDQDEPSTPLGNMDCNYRSIIGSMMYMLNSTRPELGYSVGVLSRYLNSPNIQHVMAAKRILRYLKHTANLGLTFDGSQELTLEGFADADWAGDPTDRRSVTGYVFHLCKTAVSWKSKKQPTVAGSTTEGEYMAAYFAASEAIWLRGLLAELGCRARNTYGYPV